MSSRYFVRTVNHNTSQEHYVVADARKGGACFTVYFSWHAASEEARQLNLYHHRQQLESTQEVRQRGALPTSIGQSHKNNGGASATQEHEVTPRQVMQDLMKRKLVRQ